MAEKQLRKLITPLAIEGIGQSWEDGNIAVFPILADVVKVKKGSESTARWSIKLIRLSGWLRLCFTLLITPLDIHGIGQNWEDSNITGY